MSKRWPNTPHWQRLVSTCRQAHGSRWRTCAAKLLRCEKSRLRAIVDRDLDPAEIKRLDALLIAHLHDYASRLRKRAEFVCERARDIMRATNEVSTCPDADTIMRETDTSGPHPFVAEALAALLEDA